MPFYLRHGDLSTTLADALVNAANERLAPGGGVCGALFEAAGPAQLDAACRAVAPCPTGSAVATPAFGLPARHVIHAVGPVWRGGSQGEEELLASAYRSALELATDLGDRTVAFPLLSAGIYGYPRELALAVATDAITGYLADHDDSLEVSLVLFDDPSSMRRRVPPALAEYLAGRGLGDSSVNLGEAEGFDGGPFDVPWPAVEGGSVGEATTASEVAPLSAPSPDDTGALFAPDVPLVAAPPPQAREAAAPPPMAQGAPAAAPAPSTVPDAAEPAKPKPVRRLRDLLAEKVASLDKGFSETLLDLIDQRGLTDAAVYRRANLSRQHFSKIRSNPGYRPGKPTVLALAVALELPLDQTELLLARAGYAFNPSSAADVIVRWFIEEGRYDVFEINEALYAYDQRLLGA